MSTPESFNVSGSCPASSLPNPLVALIYPTLVQDAWYWITYPWHYEVIYQGQKLSSDHTATERKQCLHVIGDKGIFDTEHLGRLQIHSSRCSLTEAPKRRGFWATLLS